MKRIVLSFLVLFISLSVFSQNVTITDDSTYTASNSAMLDVKSSDKGILLPRLSTEERLAITSPETGLLVFDTDFNNFVYYNGTNWVLMPQLDVDPTGDAPLFQVVNLTGDTIFAVYNDGVKITVPYGVKGNIGGFAVSGRTTVKGTEEPYMQITSDSTRIYVNDDLLKGSIGSFAVSGRTTTGKGVPEDILVATLDSTRVYVNESTGLKGSIGGFAVSGRTTSGKKDVTSFLNLSSTNYFIGHGSGLKNETGLYNSFLGYNSGVANAHGSANIFMGYQSGYSNVGELGNEEYASNNIFIGYRAGFSNQIGFNNIFLGYQSGYKNLGGEGFEQGSFNTFIGHDCGYENQIGGSNTFVGYQAGYSNYDGNHNTYIGRWSGAENVNGSYNVFLGTEAGRYETRSHRLHINTSNTIAYVPPLIYGEFDNRRVVINGDDTANVANLNFFVEGSAGGRTSWEDLSDRTLKRDIHNIQDALGKILSLQGVYFKWKDDYKSDTYNIGLIAQDAKEFIPELVNTHGGKYTIQYAPLTALLIEAVKEQELKIRQLESKIDALNENNHILSEENETLKSILEENAQLKEEIEAIKAYLQIQAEK